MSSSARWKRQLVWLTYLCIRLCVAALDLLRIRIESGRCVVYEFAFIHVFTLPAMSPGYDRWVGSVAEIAVSSLDFIIMCLTH